MDNTEGEVAKYYETLSEYKSTIFAGSSSLMHECIEMFNRTYPAHLENIQKAINEKDFPGIKDSVHKYKGSLKLFTDGSIIETCKNIEKSALAHDIEKSTSFFGLLQAENHLLCEALERFMQNLF